MLQPVRKKWRKAHKGRIHGNATRASTINYGAYALKALQPERVRKTDRSRASFFNTTYEKTGKSVDTNISKYTSFSKTNRSQNG